MMLKNFQLNIIIRVGLLLLLTAAIVASILSPNYILAAFLIFFLITTVTSLIQYVSRTNKDIAQFVAAVKYDDFTTNSTTVRTGGNYDDLYDSFHEVNQKFKEIRADKEANHQFLQTIVHHVDIGLLVVDANQEVVLMNQALQKLLRKSYLISVNSLKKIDEKLYEVVNTITVGQRELLKINIQNNLLQLSIQAAEITLQKEPFRLISFQDIQTELEAQELMSWQKLIRILTHEIMNSVAPISSLSSTIKGFIENAEELKGQPLEHIKKSIGVIQKRSEGLLAFTETYRKLTRVPPPSFQIVDTRKLIDEVAILMENDLQKNNIAFEKVFRTEKLQVKGDPNLLEQVLINLVKNALEASLEVEDPKIRITIFNTNEGKLCIEVADNGSGIPEEKMEQIFIPFYTTKATGSGIGLSLSRQIMRMHKGSLELQSKEGEGTVVSLYL